MDVYDVLQCVACQETSSESLSKVNVGVTTLIKFSKQWNNDKLVKHLTCQRDNNGEVLIHSKCHKDYTNRRRLDNFLKKEVVNDRKTTRQSMEQFDWKEQCFCCGADASKDKKQPDRNIVHLATTIPFRNKVLKLCEQKLNKSNFSLFIGIAIL